MRHAPRLFGSLLALLTLGACGDGQPSAANNQSTTGGLPPDSSSSGSVTDASSTGGNGSTTAGFEQPDGSTPPPLVIPDAWPARTEACGTIGDDCSSCTGSCFLGDPEFCSPGGPGGLLCTPGSCASDRPYCIQGMCMTLEGAACSCSGSVLADFDIYCKAGPRSAALAPDPAECLLEGEACADAVNPCCGGPCLMRGDETEARCHTSCSTSDECDSGCCSEGLCADRSLCAVETQACSSSSLCAAELECSSVSNGTFACYHRCVTTSDCAQAASGHVCVPLGDTGRNICVPGASEGEACNDGYCEPGLVCAGAGTPKCRKTCSSADSECQSSISGECCVPLSDSNQHICFDC